MQVFGSQWARLRLDQQLHRAHQQQPANAGPLHSQRVVLQALQQLRSLSPAYLQHLMAQADALLWLEDHGAAAPAPPAAAGNARKRRATPRPRG